MKKLKNCPICGSKAKGESPYLITCFNNDCMLTLLHTEKQWNYRPVEDGLRKRVEELSAEIVKLSLDLGSISYIKTRLALCRNQHVKNSVYLENIDYAIKKLDELYKTGKVKETGE